MKEALDWTQVTSFQRKVFEATMDVPYGRVTTYKDLGLAIGCRSPRAVGQALRRNPFAPVVPCHRVIGANCQIGGFSGEQSGPKIDYKRELLREEGVLFDGDSLAEPKRLHHF